MRKSLDPDRQQDGSKAKLLLPAEETGTEFSFPDFSPGPEQNLERSKICNTSGPKYFE